MSKSSVFPYGITLREGGTIDVFPMAEVKIQSKEGEWLSLFLLVDSGAALSALPKSDASFFGINFEKDKIIYITGIGSQPIKGWQHNLTISFGGNMMSLPFVFLDNPNAPRILGRAGLFEKFSVVFEERSKRSGFLESGSKEAGAVSKILGRIG